MRTEPVWSFKAQFSSSVGLAISSDSTQHKRGWRGSLDEAFDHMPPCEIIGQITRWGAPWHRTASSRAKFVGVLSRIYVDKYVNILADTHACYGCGGGTPMGWICSQAGY